MARCSLDSQNMEAVFEGTRVRVTEVLDTRRGRVCRIERLTSESPWPFVFDRVTVPADRCVILVLGATIVMPAP